MKHVECHTLPKDVIATRLAEPKQLLQLNCQANGASNPHHVEQLHMQLRVSEVIAFSTPTTVSTFWVEANIICGYSTEQNQ